MKLDKQQMQFVNEVLNGTSHVILTGKAGTGKSVALAAAVKALKGAGKDVLVMCPTAMAASIHRDAGIESGTIHHALRWNPFKVSLPRKLLEVASLPTDWDATPDQDRVLVIDEASMVGLWLFQILAQDLATGEEHRPFAGRRLVLVGDWAQLPPVVGKEEEESIKDLPEFTKRYGPPDGCVFYHPLFCKVPPVAIILEESHRAESLWFDALNQVRDCNKSTTLANCGITPVGRDHTGNDGFIHMCFRRNSAHQRNAECLARLPGRSYPVQVQDGLVGLKLGCDVIVTSNRCGGDYINGSRAIFSGMSENGEVLLDGDHPIKMLADGNWARGSYAGDAKRADPDKAAEGVAQAKRVLSTYYGLLEEDALKWLEMILDPDNAAMAEKYARGHIQFNPYFPILPGYALTVHKAQGCTLDGVVIEEDVFWNFAPARLPYVALSRVSNMDKVILTGTTASNARIRPDKAYPGILARLSKWVK